MKKSCFFILISCLLLSGCSKEEVLEKYNAVVEKVGEVQLTNDINLQGKRDYGEDYYTGTYQAEYKKFSDTEYLFGGTTIERAAGKQVELFCNLEITKGEPDFMELVYKKTYISKKEAMLRKNRRNIASFLLPFWEKLHQYSVFLQENRMGDFL